MNYRILTTPRFDKELKALHKKYPSIGKDLLILKRMLQENPRLGKPIGQSVFKIRILIRSKGKGKSGGGRLITYVVDKKGKIFLLSIYDKSIQDSIPDKDFKQMIKEIKQ